MDAGSILGVSELRPSLLDHVSAAESRETQTGNAAGGARAVTIGDNLCVRMNVTRLEDDIDDDLDDEDDDFYDDDDEEDDDEDDEDDDEETWQVSKRTRLLNFGLSLTSGCELPRLARISS